MSNKSGPKPANITYTYVFPGTRKTGWAYVFLTSNGVFSSQSDYGSFGYVWTDTGHDDVREFFVRPNNQYWDYFLGKFAPKEQYDGESTFRNFKTMIDGLVKSGDLDKKHAEMAIDTVEGEFASFDTEGDWHAWLSNEEGYGELCHNCEGVSELIYEGIHATRSDRMAERFVKEILPQLSVAIATELAQEKARAAANSQT